MWWKNIATLGSIGNLPMPGTIASFIALVFVVILQQFWFMYYVIALMAIFFIGLYAIQKTLHSFMIADPPQIVIDEVIGCMITFCAISFNYKSLIIGFCLFRFFDISKRCGVQSFERIGGAWGIMLDDVWAGILSNLILHAFNYSNWM